MTTASGRWAAATASVRGASHDRDGKPNQDAVRVVQVRGKTPGLVAAVCDGHGGDRYVRSDVGSRLGVEVACEVGQRALADLGPAPSPSTVEARLVGLVAESIIERWRERVLDDVQRRAFTDEERARAGVPLDGDPHISYGATLLLAILAPSWVGLLQIGDGDVTVVRQSHAESPVPSDDRLVGGETTSLCLPSAAADARSAVLVEPLPETIILTSDGYANSFASPTWRTDAGIDLREHVRRMGLDAVEARLPAWLADSATAGGDDVSMALIQRLDPVAGPAPITASSATAAAGASGERRQHRGLLPVMFAVVALAGAAAGWVLARADESTAESVTTTTAVSISTTSIAEVPTTVTAPTTTAGTDPTTPSQDANGAGGPVVGVVAVAAGDQGQLLIGDSEGLLLTFNPGHPSPDPVQFFGWVKVTGDGSGNLPDSWTFEAGQLKLNGRCVAAAAAVLYAGDYIWTVGGDGQVLTSYDPATSHVSGFASIEGGLARKSNTTGIDQPCPPAAQSGVGGSNAPSDTSQGD